MLNYRIMFSHPNFYDKNIIISPIIVMKDPQNLNPNQKIIIDGQVQDIKYFINPNVVSNVIPYNAQGQR